MPRTARNSKLENRTNRLALKKREEAYWQRVGPGVHLGYSRNAGTWRARFLIEGTKRYAKTTLGAADDHVDADNDKVLAYFQASKKAIKWAEDERRRAAAPLTVRQACERYVADMRAHGKASAKDAEQRLAKHVGSEGLGTRLVADLTLAELERWRNGLVIRDSTDSDAERRSRDSANRMINYLKATLNLAARDSSNNIADDRAWRLLQRFQNVGAQREAVLDLDQARKLIESAPNEATASLIRAGLLTGCRYGELRALRVSDFDSTAATLTIRQGKTGRRPVALDSKTVAFFKLQARNKLPSAWLLTSPRGEQWGPKDHFRSFEAARKVAKLPEDVCFYTLRHSHISHAIMAKRSIHLIAENCGTSVRMIEKNYAKWLARQRTEEIERTAMAL